MSNIEQNLAFILSSRYGEDVRQAIHDSIHDCYEDGKAGSVDLIAREQIANLVANEGSTDKDSELVDVRVGEDSFTYTSAGASVRAQTGQSISGYKSIYRDVIMKKLLENPEGEVELPLIDTYNMYNSSGSRVGVSTSNEHEIFFHEIPIPDMSFNPSFKITHDTPTEFSTFWINEYDKEGNLLRYGVINSSNGEASFTVQNEDCYYLKLSTWDDMLNVKVTASIKNPTDYKALLHTSITGAVKAGETSLPFVATDKMYNSSGSLSSMFDVRNQGVVDLKFHEIPIPDMSFNPSFKITHDTPTEFSTFWINEYDKEGNLLRYGVINSSNGEASFTVQNEDCYYLKLSTWDDMLNVKVTASISEQISGGILSAIGDSITYGYNSENGGSVVSNTYQKLISNFLGMTYQNLGISSTAICPVNNYESNVNAFVNRYDAISEDADIILICGGTNDFRHNSPIGTHGDNTATTFYGSLDVLIKGIITDHPNSRIVFIGPFHQMNDNSQNGIGVSLKQYIDAISDVCEDYGITFINGYKESGINLIPEFVTACIPDRLHPNENGHKLIYQNLKHYFA